MKSSFKTSFERIRLLNRLYFSCLNIKLLVLYRFFLLKMTPLQQFMIIIFFYGRRRLRRRRYVASKREERGL